MRHSFVIKLALIALCSFCRLIAYGQYESVKEEINRIKLNDGFYKYELSAESEAEARSKSVAALLVYVNGIMEQTGSATLDEKQFASLVKTLIVPRGESFRAFSYVDINDLNRQRQKLSSDKTATAVVSSTTEASNVTAVADTVVVEADTVMAEPVVDQVATTESNTVVQTEIGGSSVFVPTLSNANNSRSKVLQNLAGIEMLREMDRTLRSYKNDHDITDYGQLRRDTAVPADAYFVIYSREYVIQAILVPQGNGTYVNSGTNRVDALNNYPGCGAVWFKF